MKTLKSLFAFVERLESRLAKKLSGRSRFGRWLGRTLARGAVLPLWLFVFWLCWIAFWVMISGPILATVGLLMLLDRFSPLAAGLVGLVLVPTVFFGTLNSAAWFLRGGGPPPPEPNISGLPTSHVWGGGGG